VWLSLYIINYLIYFVRLLPAETSEVVRYSPDGVYSTSICRTRKEKVRLESNLLLDSKLTIRLLTYDWILNLRLDSKLTIRFLTYD
jgi:hypothetical protein